MFIESDFARFYQIGTREWQSLSWRRFQTLLSGLLAFEDSGWRRWQEHEQDSAGIVWTPPYQSSEIAPDVETGQRLLESMFFPKGG